MQVEHPWSKMLDTRSGLGFRFFFFFRFWNLCTSIRRYLVWGTQVQTHNSFTFHIHLTPTARRSFHTLLSAHLCLWPDVESCQCCWSFRFLCILDFWCLQRPRSHPPQLTAEAFWETESPSRSFWSHTRKPPREPNVLVFLRPREVRLFAKGYPAVNGKPETLTVLSVSDQGRSLPRPLSLWSNPNHLVSANRDNVFLMNIEFNFFELLTWPVNFQDLISKLSAFFLKLGMLFFFLRNNDSLLIQFKSLKVKDT